MMQWVPFGARESEIKDHIRTFAAEFSEVLVVRGAGGYGFYMLGSDAPIELDPEVTRTILARPGVLEDISSAYDSPASDIDAWIDVIDRQTWLAGDRGRGLRGTRPADHRRSPTTRVFPPAPLARHRLKAVGSGARTGRRLRPQPHPPPDAILARDDRSHARRGARLSRAPRGASPTHRQTGARSARRATTLRLDPSRDVGSARRAEPVVHAVLGVGLPSCVVGCLWRQRPRRNARRLSRRRLRRRADRDRPADASPRGRAERRGHADDDAPRPTVSG